MTTQDRIEVDRHPSSGAPIPIDLPEFDKIVQPAFPCAPSFPVRRLQAYDHAPSPVGPSVTEIDVGGDFELP